ncbi:MAG: hypothetical protein HY368_02045 [Candidatus Aenigmarchaeota archaeon]|nr:hypothetical protein [Candidatus Aenigmarchaeota archaeon]
MHSAAKMLIGLLILLAGIYWYASAWVSPNGLFGVNTVSALKTVFFGTFGVFLAFLGLLIAWIEYEDLKWEARERAEKERKK